MTPHICVSRSREEWLHQPCWRVYLSNDTVVYSLENRSSWLELKAWLKDNPDVSIEKMYLQFRDHIVEVLSGRHDYVLFHTVDCWYGSDVSQKNYFVGYRDGDKAILHKYKSPELVYVSTEERLLTDTSVKEGMIHCGEELHK